MKLKNKLDTLEGLEEKYHALYTEVDGVYNLDPDIVAEDTSALQTAKEHEKKEREKAQKKAEKLAHEKEAWAIEKAELEGDKEKAEQLRTEALDRQKAEYDRANQAEKDALKNRIHDLTVGKLQDEIASEVYIKPGVMNLSFIEERIKLNDKDEAYILDANGATMSKADFVAELKGDENMAMFIKAGDGAGGGTKPATSGGAPSGGDAELAQKKAAMRAKYPGLE